MYAGKNSKHKEGFSHAGGQKTQSQLLSGKGVRILQGWGMNESSVCK